MIKKRALLSLVILSSAHAAPSIEAGFSPDGGARKLVIKAITDAHISIKMMAYAFQAKDIVAALDASAAQRRKG